MLVLISCAKTMAPLSKVVAPFGTSPLFESHAFEIAFQMSQYSPDELAHLLKINSKLALQNFERYQYFHATDNKPLQALMAYTGVVFKHINPKDFTDKDFEYAQEHLRLTSFCYGLLRPLDLIKNYRLEGDVKLPDWVSGSLFEYWKPLLTDLLIDEVKRMGGILVYLASGEMKNLFDWKRVLCEVKVVTPEFQLEKNGKLTTVVVYTKMARGEMTRFILKERLTDINDLKDFCWEGYTFRYESSDDNNLLFTNII